LLVLDFILTTALPLYSPQKEQALCGKTDFPHLAHLFKLTFFKARCARPLLARDDDLRFAGTDIM
jgi:hypothetical protein